MKRALRWNWKRRLAVVVSVLLLGLPADYLAYPRLAHPVGTSPNRGENGLWLGHAWYFGEQTEWPQLAGRLQREQVRYAYFHVRDVKADGTLRYRKLDSARRLTLALHRQAPASKLLAWVYVGNRAGRGNVDLANPKVRKTLVGEAVWLVTVCGFDGVQWDYEICPSGDAGFPALLRETRAALPPGTLLSAAVPLWLPVPLGNSGWTDADFQAVAPLCDQMDVMCYDTGLYLPRSYVWLVHQQVVHVTAAVAASNPKCRVLFGVPTYTAGGLSHHAPAEDIRMALIGVREGMADLKAVPSVVAGVAPFADYTTQASDWKVYEQWWLKP